MSDNRINISPETKLKDLIESGFTVGEMMTVMMEMQEGKLEMAPEKDAETLEDRVIKVLHEIGVPAHLKGYKHVKSAIILVIKNAQYIEALTKWLYPTVAKEYGTTPSKVERTIRHAIEVAWERGDVEILKKYFGNTISVVKGKPTNGEFIAMIAEIIKQQNDEAGK